MKNLVYTDTTAQERITYNIEQVPEIFGRFVQLLAENELATDKPDEVIRSFFKPDVLSDGKRAKFEAFAEKCDMPREIRGTYLKQMLNSVTEESKEKLKNIRADMRYLGLDLQPEDIRFHYRKYQVTDEKKAALLAPTTRTLTDDEQRDYDAIVELIERAKPLREHNNIKAILPYFIGDKMNPQNDKPLDELLPMFLRCRELSKAEADAREKARIEADRKAEEESRAEIEKIRKAEYSEMQKKLKSGEIVNITPKSYIARIKELQLHHKMSKQRYGTFESEGEKFPNTAE